MALSAVFFDGRLPGMADSVRNEAARGQGDTTGY